MLRTHQSARKNPDPGSVRSSPRRGKGAKPGAERSAAPGRRPSPTGRLTACSRDARLQDCRPRKPQAFSLPNGGDALPGAALRSAPGFVPMALQADRRVWLRPTAALRHSRSFVTTSFPSEHGGPISPPTHLPDEPVYSGWSAAEFRVVTGAGPHVARAIAGYCPPVISPTRSKKARLMAVLMPQFTGRVW